MVKDLTTKTKMKIEKFLQSDSPMSLPMNDFQKVKQFTIESGTYCPDKPVVMSKKTVEFLIGMVLSEMQELALTVCDSKQEALKMLTRCVGTDANEHQHLQDDVHVMAEQIDALVDAVYYIWNTAAKHGHDFPAVFKVVHDANMAKKDPKTGKFIRRESDGKILKPHGWQAPDIIAEIKRQLK